MKSGTRARSAGHSIRNRILAIAWIPSLVLLVTGLALTGVLAYQGARTEGFSDDLAASRAPFSAFDQALTTEHRESELFVAADDRNAAALAGPRQRTDAATAGLLARLDRLEASDPQTFAPIRDDLRGRVAALPAFRQRVGNRQAGLLEVSTFYSSMSAAVTDSRYRLATAQPVASAAVQEAVAASLAGATGTFREADTFALASFVGPGLRRSEYLRYVELLGSTRRQLADVDPRLQPDQSAALAALLATPEWKRLRTAQDLALDNRVTPVADGAGAAQTAGTDQPAPATRTRTGRTVAAGGARAQRPAMPLTESDWTAASLTVVNGLDEIDQRITAHAAAVSGDAGHRQLVRSLLLGIGMLVLAGLVLLLTTRACNRLIGRLRRLRADALTVAHTWLPDIVDRLRDDGRRSAAAPGLR